MTARINEGILLPGDNFRETGNFGAVEEKGENALRDDKPGYLPETDSGDYVFEGNTNSLSLSKIWKDEEDNYYLGESAPEKTRSPFTFTLTPSSPKRTRPPVKFQSPSCTKFVTPRTVPISVVPASCCAMQSSVK